MDVKQCATCFESKPIDAFYVSFTRDLVFSRCIDCVKRNNWFKQISRIGLCRTRRFSSGNTIVGDLKRCKGKWGCNRWLPIGSYSTNSRGLHITCRRCLQNHTLVVRYGITIYEYNYKLNRQNHRCAICLTDYPGKGKSFSVDHDHMTGQVRGLLCHFCNLKVGFIDGWEQSRRREIMDAALGYIRSEPYMRIDKSLNLGKRERLKTEIDDDYKRCKGKLGCGRWKPLDEFYETAGYLHSYCSDCSYYAWVWNKYRMTRDDIDRLLKIQNDKCDICKNVDGGVNRHGKLFIDHRDEFVRGMLCNSCNVGIIAWLDAWNDDECDMMGDRMLNYIDEYTRENSE